MGRIVIADDSGVSRNNLRAILEGDGHNIVGEAADGAEALERYNELLPDLLTLDMEMPKMHGIEVIEQILRHHPEAKILVITSVINKRETTIALRRGAKEILHKPIKPEDLLQSIHQILRGSTQ